MRAAEAARKLARWEGGGRRPTNVGEADWLKAQPSRDRTVELGEPGRATGPNRDGALFAAVPHLWLDRSVLRARRIQGRRAQGVVAHPRALDPARLARQRARHGDQRSPCSTATAPAPTATTPPTTRRSTPPSSPLACPGRTIRVQWSREDEFAAAPISTAMAIELTAVLDADSKPADWTIEIWSPPHAQRPGMNGNANFAGTRGAAECAAAEGDRTTSATSAAAAPPATACDLRPAAPPAGPSHAAERAVADLIAARARRLGQCVRDRILHRRTGRDRRRGPGDLPAVAPLRPARPARGRDRGADERLVRRQGLAEGRARGFGFARYKNIASFAAVVAEVEVGEEVRLKRVWCAADAGLVISPDGAQEPDRGRHHPGRELRAEGAHALRGRQGRGPDLGGLSDPALFRIPEIEIELIDNPERAGAGAGRSLGRADRRRDRQRGRAGARRAHPRFAADARADHGYAVGRMNDNGRTHMRLSRRLAALLRCWRRRDCSREPAQAQELQAGKPIRLIVALSPAAAPTSRRGWWRRR